jgi:hypothetical protein
MRAADCPYIELPRVMSNNPLVGPGSMLAAALS